MPSNCPQMQPPRCPAGDPCKCPCLNPEAVTYVQPLPPPSCAPKQVYRHPKIAVEGSTVYKHSYPGFPPEVALLAKPDLCRPDQGPIKVPGVIDGHTTTTLSYQYPHGTRPQPCRPFGSNLMGRGPMQDATTQKVDYCAKPYCRREPFSDPRMPFPDTPMEGWTTTQMSYAHPQGATAAQSMKPVARVHKVPCPVDGLTTQKMSYVPPAVLPR
ncbi:stabilizer of axonemal microtubules 1-like [Thrips palmi]|uniref:Stabilizer of axonemal microtubules 1-like n=1 Tax=Thrips palmi TaxID=161013 RepID=A0A6P8ZSW7_THRPL|nr:stabilizer of axonemal microtubules 1-like [Thrips palmi]